MGRRRIADILRDGLNAVLSTVSWITETALHYIFVIAMILLAYLVAGYAAQAGTNGTKLPYHEEITAFVKNVVIKLGQLFR